MKLHIGCGNRYLEGYLNIDLYDLSVADRLMPADSLDLEDECAERIESYHLIEHLGYTSAYFALSEWFRVLKPEGRLIMEIPDIDRTFEEYIHADHKRRAELLNWVYGKEDQGWLHRFCPPPKAIEEVLLWCGFSGIEFEHFTNQERYACLSVVCNKPPQDKGFHLLAHVRKRIRMTCPVIFERQDTAVEFIKVYFEPAASGFREFLRGRDKKTIVTAIADLAAYSPDAASFLLDALPDDARKGLGNLSKIAGALAESKLVSRLWRGFSEFGERKQNRDERFRLFMDEKKRDIERLLEEGGPLDEKKIAAIFGPPGDPAEFPSPVFSLAMIEDKVGSIASKAQKAFLKGDRVLGNDLLFQLSKWDPVLAGDEAGNEARESPHGKYHLRSVLWEITSRCNLKCEHCLVRAGRVKRPELSTKDALDVCRQIKEAGCGAVCLMGGEVFVRRDWEKIARELINLGINYGVFTNAMLFDEAMARKIEKMGIVEVGLSLDGGSARVHNAIRGHPKSFERAVRAIKIIGKMNLCYKTIVTSVNRKNVDDLENILNLLLDICGPGFVWTVNTSSAHDAKTKYMALDEEGYERVARFCDRHVGRHEDKLEIVAADDIGYYSARYPNLRPEPWGGCSAGIDHLGITCSGDVKGCLVLPDGFIAGNVMKRPLKDIWEDDSAFAWNRNFTPDMLAGKCRGCPYGAVCKGGCSDFSFTHTGSPYEHPFCLRRRDDQETASPAGASKHTVGVVCIELTRKCNLRCIHCGSTSGRALKNELTTDEFGKFFKDLAVLGADIDVTLLGGEPFLRKDWKELGCSVKENGHNLIWVTNGTLVDEKLVRELKDIDTDRCGVSIDGATARTHDAIRCVRGSFDKAWRAVSLLSKNGINTTVITTLSKRNFGELEDMMKLVLDKEIGWQIQMATCNGQRFSKDLALDEDEFYSAAEIIAKWRAKYSLDRLPVAGAHDFGYHSRFLKNYAIHPDWPGCQAGVSTFGLTSTGNVKPCLSMDDSFAEDNIRKRSIIEIWNDPKLFSINRKFVLSDLGGDCKNCPHGATCRGGCSDKSFALAGCLHADPMCLYRIEGRKNVARR